MQDSDNLLKSYIQKVLKLQQEQKQRPLDEGEMHRIAEELGLSDNDLAYIKQRFNDYIARGQGYSRYEDWESAIEEFEQAFELNPASVDVLYGLANAYKNIWLHTRDKDILQKAKDFVKRALQVDPNHEASFKLAGELNKGLTGRTNPTLNPVGKDKDNVFGGWREWEDDFKDIARNFKNTLKRTTDPNNPKDVIMRNLTEKRLKRSSRDSKIMGVCGGIAEYVGIDPTWVRLAFILGIFLGGMSPIAYIIMGFVMPKDKG
jgi:phage shock protein PspC (stress-responsive transcriptional regulator)